jgi:hypothetical protein
MFNPSMDCYRITWIYSYDYIFNSFEVNMADDLISKISFMLIIVVALFFLWPVFLLFITNNPLSIVVLLLLVLVFSLGGSKK